MALPIRASILRFCFLIAGLSSVFPAIGQINIDTSLTPFQYINNLVGLGVSFNNVQFQGDEQAVGFFSGANGSLGFSSGVILSTGPAANASDNSTFGASLQYGLTDMPDLLSLVPTACFSAVNDGVELEFQFVPQSSPVSFRYIFASEEYPEYVCSQFNDAFAFLISGPGIAGTQNLALVPGSGDPITISYINNGSVGANGNQLNDPCVLTNSQYFNFATPTGISYDGYTNVMTAVADVIPCSTYTLRLLLADYCDGGFDSAVFLEANSFGAAPISISQTTLNGDSTTYEGCAPAVLRFSRQNADPFDYVFPFTLTGTAQNGVDYSPVPPTVTIPAGQTFVDLPISATVDAVIEGSESVILSYETICGSISTTVFITEAPIVTVTSDPAPSMCDGQGPVTISGAASGGVAPLVYSWSNSLGTTTSASVNPNATTTYVLTATDFCGTVGTANITVPVGVTPGAPVIQLPVDPICENETINLSASTATAGATLEWAGPNTYSNTGTSVLINSATVLNAGVYSVFATLTGCDSPPTEINMVVNPRPSIPVLTSNSPVCEGSSIDLTATVTPANSVITWNGPNLFSATGAQVSIASAALNSGGLFAATATLNGCDATAGSSTQVFVNDTPDAPSVTASTPVCATFTLDLSTTATADSYQWSGPQAFTAATQAASRPAMSSGNAGIYSLVVTVNNCPSPATDVTVQVIDASFLPQILSNSPVCAAEELTFNTPLVNTAQYFWNGPNGFSSSDQNPSIGQTTEAIEGDYTLYLVIGSCTTATSTLTTDIVPVPVPEAGLDIQTCSMVPGQLGGAGTTGYSYTWAPAEGLDFATIPNPSVTLNNVTGLVQPRTYVLTASFNGCSAKDTVLAEILPQPIASFEVPEPQCYEGHSFDFKGDGFYSSANPRFVWEFGPLAQPDSSSDINPQDVTFGQTGLQMVKLTIIDRGCVSNTFSAPVTIFTMPVSNFVPDQFEVCEPKLIRFTNISESNGNDLIYNWDFGNEVVSTLENPTALYSRAGKYDVSLTVTSNEGCSNTYSVNDMLTVNPSPQASFNIFPGNVINISDPQIIITDLSTHASECMYIIGTDSIFEFDKTYTFRDSGTYTIYQLLSNEFGCTDSYKQEVRVDLGYKVYIPTSFTPNDDGLNDYFRIYGEDIQTTEIFIYNRWGQMIYSSYDIENGWDGRTKLDGSVVQGGTYIYSIKLVDTHGVKFDYDGTVVVLK